MDVEDRVDREEKKIIDEYFQAAPEQLRELVLPLRVYRRSAPDIHDAFLMLKIGVGV